jgi:hypothetical protein
MAGYVKIKTNEDTWTGFHIGDKDLAHKIRNASESRVVITLQLDCDELDAALWGFENYKKGFHEAPGY